jgi:signal transduction histidine kinase
MDSEALQDVILAVTAERSTARILAQIVRGLAAQPGVVLARVWLVGPGDICETCPMRAECPDQTRCLHLSASAGTPTDGREDWARLNGAFRRFPLNVRKIGRIGATGEGMLINGLEREHDWIARPDWLRSERISSFGGQPLVSRGEVLGVLAVFHREPCDRRTFAWLRTFADHAANAISNARALEEVEQLKEQLDEAQRLSCTGSFAWRAATNEITCSDQSRHIFEIESATPVTLALIVSRIHPEDVSAFRERLERARSGATVVELDLRLQLANGAIKYLHMVAHGGRDHDLQWRYIGAIQDVTQRRLSDEALERARAELTHVARVTSLGALTASIAHEVSQPLSGIGINAGACLRMLGSDPPNVDGARVTAQRVIRDVDRASEVIARLRALFGKTGDRVESVDLNEATREVIALSSNELTKSRVVLRVELFDDLPRVAGDRIQLQQVILNLLLNASDAMSAILDRPRLLVIRTARDDDDRVRLAVQDAGVGVELQSVDKLFEAFHTTKSSGMGMGLSISRAIVENHRGRLWAVPNEGPGATFSFSIPRWLDA